MKSLFIIVMAIISTNVLAESVSRIDKLESRIDDIELKSALQKFRFSGSFLNHVESFSSVKKNTDLLDSEPTPYNTALKGDSTDVNIVPMVMRVELNFDANITKNINFYSTLGMSKFWNLSGRNTRAESTTGSLESLSGSYAIKDSTAKFDTAYINYQFQDSPWSIAIGRMTTAKGPPHNQLDGVARTGTYPFLSYNVVADGIAAIYNFKNIVPKDQSLKMRLFYTPFILVDKNNKGKQVVDSDGDIVSNTQYGESKEQLNSHVSVITLLTEYSLKKLSWTKKLDIYHSIFKVNNYFDENFQKLEQDAPTPAYEPYLRKGVELTTLLSNTVYIGMKDVFNSNFNLSLSGNFMTFTSNFSEEFYSQNYLVSLNYKFDNNLNAGDILGIEYITTDENNFTRDWSTLYVSDFYDITNGKGLHAFYTKAIGVNQVIRIGHFAYTQGESEQFSNDLETKDTSTYARWKLFF